MGDLTCQEIADALKLWQSLCGPLHADESPVTVLALALRAAEERGEARMRKFAASRVADVIEEFERRRPNARV
jgi:hypothetical protein